MNKCLSLVHLITSCLLPVYMASAGRVAASPNLNLSIDPEQVVVLHVRPGYVSSVGCWRKLAPLSWATRCL